MSKAVRILMVDDEPEFYNPLVEALTDAEYEVTTANNPDDAMVELADKPFDLITLDLLMPPFKREENNDVDLAESGVSLHREIRNIPRLANIPIVFISVVRDQEVMERLKQIEGPAFWFLTKPVLPSLVLEEIRKALGYYESAKK